MDCYDKILRFYEENEAGEALIAKVWLNKFLVELMAALEDGTNETRIRNCLILLINLCFGIEYPDHYHTKGKSDKKLSDNEKELLNSLLRSEMNLNNCN